MVWGFRRNKLNISRIEFIQVFSKAVEFLVAAAVLMIPENLTP